MRLNLPTTRQCRWLALPVIVVLAATFAGCQTASYYSQAVRGQYRILVQRQSCRKLLADSKTTEELKTRLTLAGQICDFAERELKLPANGHYRCYVDLHRRFAVWNIYAAPNFSLESKNWWYPLVGSLDYRGFFDQDDARDYAARLDRRGFDTYVEGVEAYSTLGWFRDPLLNTFVHHSETSLAEILFHELAHQRVFAGGDTDFNEAFATTVGEEGVRRWLRANRNAEEVDRYDTALQRNVQFVQLIAATRKKLEAVYADTVASGGKIKAAKRAREIPSGQLLRDKRRIQDELRRDYEQLKTNWNGYAGYDSWFASDLNNAQLNSVAAYFDLVPAFERLLADNDGDLEKFYAAVKQLAKLPKGERHRRLQAGGMGKP